METKKNVSDLFTSTPDPAGRLEKEMLCYELLEKCQIPFAGVDHPPALTVDDCHDADILLGIHICKNLFLCNRQKTAFYLLLMPGHKVFKTRQLNVTPGSVTVMGLMFDLSRQVQLLIDRDLLKEEVFGFHPCINTSSLRISTDDLIHKLIPALGHEPLYVDLTEETSPS